MSPRPKMSPGLHLRSKVENLTDENVTLFENFARATSSAEAQGRKCRSPENVARATFSAGERHIVLSFVRRCRHHRTFRPVLKLILNATKTFGPYQFRTHSYSNVHYWNTNECNDKQGTRPNMLIKQDVMELIWHTMLIQH